MDLWCWKQLICQLNHNHCPPHQAHFLIRKNMCNGSGCGSVGRTIACNTRGPRFESSHRQLLQRTFVYCQLYWKTKIKKKEARNGPFKKQYVENLTLKVADLFTHTCSTSRPLELYAKQSEFQSNFFSLSSLRNLTKDSSMKCNIPAAIRVSTVVMHFS